MEYRQRAAGAPERLRELHETAGVRARDGLRPGREDVGRLAVAELAGRVGLDDVVDPGGAAAQVLLRRLDYLEPRNPAQRRERRERQALRVPEVAGVLERDRCRQRVPRRPRECLGEQFADVAHLLGEALGSVVAEQPAELFQMRPAAGRVDDDQLDVLEGVDEPPREALSLLEAPRVHRERAAAALRRSNDLEAVRGENARGRGVHVGEHGALHAAA